MPSMGYIGSSVKKTQGVGVQGSGVYNTEGGYDGSFGLSAEVRRKQDMKYDHDLEALIADWIEEVTGSPLKDVNDFHGSLKSGVRLCRLMNKLRPKSIKSINRSKMAFQQMGNISSFLQACRDFGLSEHDLFSTVDLYEKKNMGAVLMTLDALRRGGTGNMRKAPRKKKVPMGGLSVAASQAPIAHDEPVFDRVTMGADAGAMGSHPGTHAVKSAAARSARRKSSSGGPGMGYKAEAVKGASGKYATSGDYDGSFGLSAELRAKQDAKYDVGLEEEIQDWIAETLHIHFDHTFQETLQDGTVLCRLMKAVWPPAKKHIKKVNHSKLLFKQMENCKKFLTAARHFGIAEHSLFSVVDLTEGKNMGNVLMTLDAIRRGCTGRTEAVKDKTIGSMRDYSLKDTGSGQTRLDKVNRNNIYTRT